MGMSISSADLHSCPWTHHQPCRGVEVIGAEHPLPVSSASYFEACDICWEEFYAAFKTLSCKFSTSTALKFAVSVCKVTVLSNPDARGGPRPQLLRVQLLRILQGHLRP